METPDLVNWPMYKDPGRSRRGGGVSGSWMNQLTREVYKLEVAPERGTGQLPREGRLVDLVREARDGPYRGTGRLVDL